MRLPASDHARMRVRVIVAVVVIVAALFLGGAGWAIWWLNDNIGAPGPGATGSGRCTSADSVNIQMVFADGHSVQACTHDRPACPNHTISGNINGVSSSVSEFGFGNQLRSSSRRYIFGVRFNSTLPAEASEQTVYCGEIVYCSCQLKRGPSSTSAKGFRIFLPKMPLSELIRRNRPRKVRV